MLLGDDDAEFEKFDLIAFIVDWMNYVESQQTPHNRWPSEQKIDFVLAKVEEILSAREYRNNETLLIIVINALNEMGKHYGKYRVKSNNEHCCNCCCIL